MPKTYGMERVLEPQHVLPTSAWRLDNSRNIYPEELRVSIKRIHLEGTGFKQICTEVNDDEQKIKQQIIDIVIRRGKLHNPVTDTGGLVMGVIEEIGSRYENPQGLKVGDKIICNTSLASVPMYIEDITAVNRAFSQIEARGYAIIHDQIQVVKIPEDLPLDLLMFTFDLSGTLFRLHTLLGDNKKFLVVGNNMLTNLLYGYVIRREAGPEAEIVCLFDKRTSMRMAGRGIDELLGRVFNQIHFINILRPMECMRQLDAESLFDFSINCAEIPGAETINLLATRPGGTVLFANLINNLNIALYITESMSKPLCVRCAEGYLAEYDIFDMEVVREMAPFLRDAEFLEPAGRKSREEDDPLRRDMLEKTMVEDFVCRSKVTRQVLREMLKVARYDCNVIIFGDTGVGKEKAANIIQKNSARKMSRYLRVDQLRRNLAFADRIGVFRLRKGRLHGSERRRQERFFRAGNNGVIFLDEIGELPLEMQAKLLRAIQDGEFYAWAARRRSRPTYASFPPPTAIWKSRCRKALSARSLLSPQRGADQNPEPGRKDGGHPGADTAFFTKIRPEIRRQT